MVMKYIESISTELESIVKSQQDIVDGLQQIMPANNDHLSSLKSDLTSISLESLCILVYGEIACGKSSLINAIQGCNIAPHRHLPILQPCITEYKHSMIEKAILYSCPKKYNHNDRPFEIQIDEVRTYLSLPDSDNPIKDSPFYKLEINSSKCQSGVILIDTTIPYWCSDLLSCPIVEQLYKVDAVIYCMRADHAYSAKDKDDIESLRDLGYTSIIFVLTGWDCILDYDEMMGTNDAVMFKEHLIRNLLPLTDLGENGIFFVDSLGALKGKIENDEFAVEKSGILHLDSYLSDLMIQKQKRALLKIAEVNKHISEYIQNFLMR